MARCHDVSLCVGGGSHLGHFAGGEWMRMRMRAAGCWMRAVGFGRRDAGGLLNQRAPPQPAGGLGLRQARGPRPGFDTDAGVAGVARIAGHRDRGPQLPLPGQLG